MRLLPAKATALDQSRRLFLPGRTARIGACVAILLLLCLLLLGQIVRLTGLQPVTAQIAIPQEGVRAPAVPIRPVSVSVVDFTELAAR